MVHLGKRYVRRGLHGTRTPWFLLSGYGKDFRVRYPYGLDDLPLVVYITRALGRHFGCLLELCFAILEENVYVLPCLVLFVVIGPAFRDLALEASRQFALVREIFLERIGELLFNPIPELA